jgi:hypothetical protein
MVIGAVVRSGLREIPTRGGPLLEFTKILKSAWGIKQQKKGKYRHKIPAKI